METKSARRILVATDFSEGSDEALERAIDSAKESRSGIEIVHVIDLSEEFPFGMIYLDADHYADVDRELSRRADRVRSAGLSCETKILEGDVSSEIAKRGRDIDAALIVVGTHGRTGIARVMLGSVAERVVRHASCSVLTVPYSRRAA
jgi:nucleotide-binding universal stress UspA family protein